MEEHHELTGEVTQLCNSFISEWMKQIDIQQYLEILHYYTFPLQSQQYL